MKEDQLIELRSILAGISTMLEKDSHIDQMIFLSRLIDKIGQTNSDFIHDLNSENFWGGSGSILDIEFNDPLDKTRLKSLLKELLIFLSKAGILGKRARSANRLLS
ncbi:MAG: hypothetical protein ACKO96_04710 [Flammeovirgaceae bacterium]